MNALYKINNLFRPAQITPIRMALAVIAALVADGLQIPLQAVPLAPEIIDVIAMGITTAAIGFHLLLLPTFVVELIPVADMLPTWTGCVIAVIALRKNAGRAPQSTAQTSGEPRLLAPKGQQTDGNPPPRQ